MNAGVSEETQSVLARARQRLAAITRENRAMEGEREGSAVGGTPAGVASGKRAAQGILSLPQCSPGPAFGSNTTPAHSSFRVPMDGMVTPPTGADTGDSTFDESLSMSTRRRGVAGGEDLQSYLQRMERVVAEVEGQVQAQVTHHQPRRQFSRVGGENEVANAEMNASTCKAERQGSLLLDAAVLQSARSGALRGNRYDPESPDPHSPVPGLPSKEPVSNTPEKITRQMAVQAARQREASGNLSSLAPRLGHSHVTPSAASPNKHRLQPANETPRSRAATPMSVDEKLQSIRAHLGRVSSGAEQGLVSRETASALHHTVASLSRTVEKLTSPKKVASGDSACGSSGSAIEPGSAEQLVAQLRASAKHMAEASPPPGEEGMEARLSTAEQEEGDGQVLYEGTMDAPMELSEMACMRARMESKLEGAEHTALSPSMSPNGEDDNVLFEATMETPLRVEESAAIATAAAAEAEVSPSLPQAALPTSLDPQGSTDDGDGNDALCSSPLPVESATPPAPDSSRSVPPTSSPLSPMPPTDDVSASIKFPSAEESEALRHLEPGPALGEDIPIERVAASNAAAYTDAFRMRVARLHRLGRQEGRISEGTCSTVSELEEVAEEGVLPTSRTSSPSSTSTSTTAHSCESEPGILAAHSESHPTPPPRASPSTRDSSPDAPVTEETRMKVRHPLSTLSDGATCNWDFTIDGGSPHSRSPNPPAHAAPHTPPQAQREVAHAAVPHTQDISSPSGAHHSASSPFSKPGHAVVQVNSPECNPNSDAHVGAEATASSPAALNSSSRAQTDTAFASDPTTSRVPSERTRVEVQAGDVDGIGPTRAPSARRAHALRKLKGRLGSARGVSGPEAAAAERRAAVKFRVTAEQGRAAVTLSERLGLGSPPPVEVRQACAVLAAALEGIRVRRRLRDRTVRALRVEILDLASLLATVKADASGNPSEANMETQIQAQLRARRQHLVSTLETRTPPRIVATAPVRQGCRTTFVAWQPKAGKEQSTPPLATAEAAAADVARNVVDRPRTKANLDKLKALGQRRRPARVPPPVTNNENTAPLASEDACGGIVTEGKATRRPEATVEAEEDAVSHEVRTTPSSGKRPFLAKGQRQLRSRPVSRKPDYSQVRSQVSCHLERKFIPRNAGPTEGGPQTRRPVSANSNADDGYNGKRHGNPGSRPFTAVPNSQQRANGRRNGGRGLRASQGRRRAGAGGVHVPNLGPDVYMLSRGLYDVGEFGSPEDRRYSPTAIAWGADHGTGGYDSQRDERRGWVGETNGGDGSPHDTPELPSSSYYDAIQTGDVDWAATLDAVRGRRNFAAEQGQEGEGPLDDILGQVTDLLTQVNSILGQNA